MSLCKYSNYFGEPEKGIHSYRIGDIAIVDVIATVIGAMLISKMSGKNFNCILLFLFLLGIFLHWLFCVPTTINNFLNL